MMGRAKRKARLHSPEPPGLGRPFVVLDAADRGAASAETAAPETAVDAALERGYRDGLARAQQELAAEVEAFRAEVRASLQRIADYEKTFVAENETRMLELTLAAASRIVRERIEAGDEVATRAFAEALAALPDSTTVRARVHADDLESILDVNREAVEAGRIELVADESLSRGGVILESDLGRVDATIETAEQAALDAALDNDVAR